jgi:transposase-like protein
MAHANARPNLFARRLIVERVAAGWPAAHVAEQLGLSRATVYKWLRRHAEGGDAALADRSWRPVRMPNRTPAKLENRVLAARRRRKRGAVVLAAELGMNRPRWGGSWLATRCPIWPRSTRSPVNASVAHDAAKTVTSTAHRGR